MIESEHDHSHDSAIIKEERSVKELDKTEYEIQNIDQDTEMDDEDLEKNDQMILANLNIMKENMMEAPEYQVKQSYVGENDGQETRTFFT